MKLESIKITLKNKNYLLEWSFKYKNKKEKIWFLLNQNQVIKKNLKKGNSFLCFSILPAMLAKEDIDLNGFEISPKLLSRIKNIQNIYTKWYPHINLKKIKVVNYQLNKIENKTQDKIASFFSCGIDSFDTILQNKKLKTKDRINTILFVFGFDIHVKDKKLSNQTKKMIDLASKDLSLEPIYIKSNIREFTERFFLWDCILGSILSSISHLFEGFLSKIYISSTRDYKHLIPDGSHPKLDYLFSSENLKIIHFGSTRSRIDKIFENVSKSKTALKNLKVCWLNKGGKINCCTCEKCLRTMIGLELAGVLNNAEKFEKKLTNKLLSNIKIDKYSSRNFYTELLEKAKNTNSKRITIALEKAIKKFDLQNKNTYESKESIHKIKNIIFVDFNGIISYNNFWKSLENLKHPLHEDLEKINLFLFKENKQIVSDWMLGKFTSEDIHQIISKKLNINYASLFETFKNDCANIDISKKIVNQLKKLKKYYKVILITDNMDSFDRYTLPNNPILNIFDEIDNSYNMKKFKSSDNGKYFLEKIKKNKASIENCILIDDSENNCNKFKNLGGMAFNIKEGENSVVKTCKMIKKRALSKWEWQY